MERHRRAAQAPRRSDSQSCRDGERLRHARARDVRRTGAAARPPAKARAMSPQRAQTEQAITAAIGKVMAVAEAYPGTQSEREFPVAAERARRRRRSDPTRAPLLQWHGARLQCDDRAVSVEPCRRFRFASSRRRSSRSTTKPTAPCPRSRSRHDAALRSLSRRSFLSGAHPARADERITDFSSDITCRADGRADRHRNDFGDFGRRPDPPRHLPRLSRRPIATRHGPARPCRIRRALRDTRRPRRALQRGLHR